VFSFILQNENSFFQYFILILNKDILTLICPIFQRLIFCSPKRQEVTIKHQWLFTPSSNKLFQEKYQELKK
jgi:hypothetical protein